MISWFKKHLHLTWLFYMATSPIALLLLSMLLVNPTDINKTALYAINQVWRIIIPLSEIPLTLVISIDKIFEGDLRAIMDIISNIVKVILLGSSTIIENMELAGQGKYIAAIGNTIGQIWLMFIPIPINIWVLQQKKRNWAWSLFTLWTLCWIPLILSNKNKLATLPELPKNMK